MDIINLFLHLDKFIFAIVDTYGVYTYLLTFLVIFFETGIVIAPILPGDTILFAVGTLAGIGKLNIWYLIVLLSIAAILGDSLNYYIGEKFGKFILRKKWISQKKVDDTQTLYQRHGGKIIIFGRFFPIIRTFAPFVAGMGKMHYGKFLKYNILGAITWILTFLALGYFFGNLPFIRDNFTLVIIFILVLFFPVTIIFKYLLREKKI